MPSSQDLSTVSQRPPKYSPPGYALPRLRLKYLLCNYLNEPFLLHVPSTGLFFSRTSTENIHFKHKLELSKPLHVPLFKNIGLDTFGGLSYIEITVKTAVRTPGPQNPGKFCYVHIIQGDCYRQDGRPLYIQGHDGMPTPFMTILEFGPTQPVADGDVSWKYQELYT